MSALLLLFLLWARALLAIKIIGAGSGVDNSSRPRPLRYEINNFSQSQEPWDLYVQSLSQIQGRSQSDPMSYFQIAGTTRFSVKTEGADIDRHSWPATDTLGQWVMTTLRFDVSSLLADVQGAGSYPGYCMHTSTLFPPWHRPYLALFEARIQRSRGHRRTADITISKRSGMPRSRLRTHTLTNLGRDTRRQR
jgi:tyrosinase